VWVVSSFVNTRDVRLCFAVKHKRQSVTQSVSSRSPRAHHKRAHWSPKHGGLYRNGRRCDRHELVWRGLRNDIMVGNSFADLNAKRVHKALEFGCGSNPFDHIHTPFTQRLSCNAFADLNAKRVHKALLEFGCGSNPLPAVRSDPHALHSETQFKMVPSKSGGGDSRCVMCVNPEANDRPPTPLWVLSRALYSGDVWCVCHKWSVA